MLIITIGWEWALGILGILLLMAWNGSARFTALETSMEWVKRTLIELASVLKKEDGDRAEERSDVGKRANESVDLEAFLGEAD